MYYPTYLSLALLTKAISAFPLESPPLLERSINTFPSLTNTTIPYFGSTNGNFQTPKAPQFSTLSAQVQNEVVLPPYAVETINNDETPSSGAGTDVYRRYSGGGSAGEGWPTKPTWVSFSKMFEANKPLMLGSCEWNEWGARDSQAEVQDIYDAIQNVAADTKVDHRIILAVVMQESGGCVRAVTSENGVRNPGLMQSHNGDGTCNDLGNVQTPCPASIITQMIRDGAGGTRDGEGLAGALNRAATMGSGTRSFFVAARLYNSGSVNNSNLNDGLGARACYVMDIANRLTGWTFAARDCGL